MSTIVGLSGYGRSGKDTVGAFLGSRRFHRVAFADKLRDFLYALNPCIGLTEQTSPVYLQDLVDSDGWENAKKLGEVTRLLQRCGTEAGQYVLWPTVWVDAVFRELPLLDVDLHADDQIINRYVFTDVRFLHECEAIKSRGGKIWRINRPGQGPKTNHRGEVHHSETALDEYEFDLVIDNEGTVEELRDKVLALADLWGWR